MKEGLYRVTIDIENIPGDMYESILSEIEDKIKEIPHIRYNFGIGERDED